MPFIYTSAPWGQPKSFLVSKTLNFTLQRFYPPFSVEYIQVFCLICSQKYSLRYFGIYGALSFCIRFYHLWLFDLHRFFFTYHYKWFCNIQYQFKNFFQLQGIIMSPDNNSSSWYSNVCFTFFQNNCSAARCQWYILSVCEIRKQFRSAFIGHPPSSGKGLLKLSLSTCQ